MFIQIGESDMSFSIIPLFKLSNATYVFIFFTYVHFRASRNGSPCNWNCLFRKIMDMLMDVMDPLKKKRLPYQSQSKCGWIIPMWV